MPLVSVIVPVYNGEKTIRETLESVLNQTYTDFELIIINSSSTDSTLAVINQFSDPRIKVFTYPKAVVSINRNRGFQHATGQFITFLDADDLWTVDKLELQIQSLLCNSEVGVVYSWMNCIDEQGKFLRKASQVYWQGNVYPHLLLDDFIGSGSNVMIRREAFTAVGGFDEQLTNAQDTDLWLKLAAKYPFTVVPKPQILYRISAQSMSSNVRGLEQSNLAIIQKNFAQADPSLQYIKPHSIANLYKYLLYKALDVAPEHKESLLITRMLWQSLMTDPALLKTPIFYKAGLKFLIMLLLPAKIATQVLTKFPKLANTSTLLGYEKNHLQSLAKP